VLAEDLDKVKLYELFEADDFSNDDPLRIQITAVLSQIKADIEDSSYKKKFTVNALLEKLADNGVKISRAQLLDLVYEEPWNNLISDVKDDTVEFNGDGEDPNKDTELDPEEPVNTAGTLDQMAKRAVKNQGM
jgi:hypothetical protein